VIINFSLSAAIGAAALAPIALLTGAWSDSGPPPIASGQLMTRAGAPAPDAPVTLSTLSTDETGTTTSTLIGETSTDANGMWEIDRPREPVVLGQLEVVGIVGDESVIYDYIATLGSPSASRTSSVRSSKAHEAGLTLQIGVGRVQHPRLSGPTSIRKDLSLPDVVGDDGSSGFATGLPDDPDRRADGPVDGSPAAAGKPESSCWVHGYEWHPTNHYRTGWVPIRWTKTEGKSTVHYSWTTSTETQLGVTIAPTVGPNYAGGLGYSVKNDTSMTISPDWPNNTDKTALVEWKYRKMQAWCPDRPTLPHGPVTPGYPLSLWKWQAWRADGYTKANQSTHVTINCMDRGPVAFTTTLTRDHSETFNSWFSIAGVGLQSSQTQSEATSVTLRPDPGQVPKFCSSDSDGPRYSAWVWESN
jgi:hypothetical protein